MVEVESLERFDALVAAGARSAGHWRVQDVDLTERDEALRGLDVEGALLLGCALDTEVENDLRARGALVFPQLPHVPVNPYRAELYTPQELYAGLDQSYADTLDARAYAWSRSSRDLGHDLAQALHDHAIDDALTGFAASLRLVGVMGGHALERGEPEYVAEGAYPAISPDGRWLAIDKPVTSADSNTPPLFFLLSQSASAAAATGPVGWISVAACMSS